MARINGNKPNVWKGSPVFPVEAIQRKFEFDLQFVAFFTSPKTFTVTQYNELVILSKWKVLTAADYGIMNFILVETKAKKFVHVVVIRVEVVV